NQVGGAVACAGGDGHAAAPSIAQHVRNGRLMGIEHAVQIDAHDFVELGGRLLQKGHFDAQDTCTADQDVDAAELRHGLLYQAVDRGLVGHVGGDEATALAQSLNLGGDFRATFQQVGDDHVAALLGDAQGAGAAQAPGSAGD